MMRWPMLIPLLVAGWAGVPTAGAVEVVEVVDSTPSVAAPTALPSGKDCSASSQRQRIGVSVVPPEGAELSTVVVDLDYPETQVALPGTRNEPSVSARLSDAPGVATVAMNDKDASVRVVVTAGAALPTSKRLFVLEFDLCSGALPPAADDYRCTISGCVAMSAPVDGCTCRVALEAAAIAPAAKP